MRTASISTEAVSVYNSALSFAADGAYTEALNEYQRAISLCPNFVEAYNNIGEIYSQLGNKVLAINSYEQALEIEKNEKVLLNLGVEYYNNANYSIAITYFRESLKISSDFLEANFYAGLTEYSLKNYDAALVYLNKVVNYDCKNVKANFILASIYYDRQDYVRVIQCLDRIKDIAEDKCFVSKYYGCCLYHLGRYNEALDYLSNALESNPKYEVFKEYLESLTVENKLKEIGNLDREIAKSEKMMKTSIPTIKDYTRLAMLYVFSGEYKKAEELLSSVAA